MLKGLQWLSLVACYALGTIIACVVLVQNWDNMNLVPLARAQDISVNKPKFVEIQPDIPCEAARVVKVTVGTQDVTPGFRRPHHGPSGPPFQAGDDWLKDMTFTIRNRSTRTLVELAWAASFPETEATGYVITQHFDLGRVPENAAYTREGNKLIQGSRQSLDLHPGQEIMISLMPYADDIRKLLEQRQPFSTIHTCFISVHAGYFADGMQWVLADYNVPDPSHPGFFKPADVSQLPVKDTRGAYAPNETHN